jgi:hypothetical protein
MNQELSKIFTKLKAEMKKVLGDLLLTKSDDTSMDTVNEK